MEATKAIDAIKNYFEGEYFAIVSTCSSLAVPERAEKQIGKDSEPFDHIFVDQDYGGGATDDDYHGCVYFPVEDGRYIVADY
jgi:hypothetical protein